MTRIAAAMKRSSPWLAVLAVVMGCSTRSAIDRFSDAWARAVVAGAPFQHLAIYDPAIAASATLHVYLEGDGRPWLDGGTTVAADPTPRDALALRLMQRDGSPSLYLGRPCHFIADDPRCAPRYWTSERYAQVVVDSLYAALNRLVALDAYREVVLIGYSGGGVIAVLLAERMRRPLQVVTLAANLDTDAWTRHHGYLPLTGSRNPARDYQPAAEVRQHHYAGALDTVVPATVTAAFADRYGYPMTLLARYDHRCCWERDWPKLLSSSLRDLRTPPLPVPP